MQIFQDQVMVAERLLEISKKALPVVTDRRVQGLSTALRRVV